MEDQALHLTVARVRIYRPEVSAEYIREVVDQWLATSRQPENEVDQDIVFIYESSLRWVEHSKGQGR